jgi:hypothetical protein
LEQIIGTLSGVHLHTFDVEYDLFFTDTRLIAFNIRYPGNIGYHYDWKNMFIGGSGQLRNSRHELERVGEVRRNKEQDLNPDELVAASSRNFFFRYSDITTNEVRRRFCQWQLIFDVQAEGKPREIRFYISSRQVPEARHLLTTIKK